MMKYFPAKLKQSRPSTFSIVARDPENGDLGVIVQSKFPAVGSVVPWATADVGAIATQALANTSYGPRGLVLMSEGKSAQETLDALLASDELTDQRQVGIVDSSGRAASHTGRECIEWAGHVIGDGYACQGNILASEAVVSAMADTYERTEGDLIDKLFATLKAGQAQGGDRRGMQSAAMLVVRKNGGYGGGNDRYVDVRVDEHPSPIEELERIFKIYDMTLLSREPPSQLIKLEGEAARNVQEALVSLGYLSSVDDEAFSPEAATALQKFMDVSNFENKSRDDGTIWQSVLEYLLHAAGLILDT
ncbi:MAG TPA: DUF1028 domain-containing protein [Candidatus Lokiarchaeia archaeon]|nr:DUF1028 domain-containing protein [Candidatus Lokiarchaeia archaeon]